MIRESIAAGRVGTTLAFIFAVLAAWTAPAGEEAGKVRILATLFPQYDFARHIAGGRAEVAMLLPPGAESHSYEPTPSDMRTIAAADLFIHTGPHMEPWAKRLADSAATPGTVLVVDASAGIPLRREDGADWDDDHNHDHEDHHDAGGHIHLFDPHIWLNPILAAAMVDTIAAALMERDPANADVYRKNADDLKAGLRRLDEAFRKTVADSSRRTLVFGERFAFGYFFERYGLEEVGAYNSCAPGAEPGLKAVIAVIDYVKRNQVRYIYREASAKARISNVVAEETKVEILAVDSMHTLPADRLAAGVTYLELMEANMDAFAKGLR